MHLHFKYIIKIKPTDSSLQFADNKSAVRWVSHTVNWLFYVCPASCLAVQKMTQFLHSQAAEVPHTAPVLCHRRTSVKTGVQPTDMQALLVQTTCSELSAFVTHSPTD